MAMPKVGKDVLMEYSGRVEELPGQVSWDQPRFTPATARVGHTFSLVHRVFLTRVWPGCWPVRVMVCMSTPPRAPDSARRQKCMPDA